MRIAVTGGTGLIGRFVVNDLLSYENEVRVLARSSVESESFGARHDLVDLFVGDMSDSESVDSFLTDADAVVHAAFAHVPGRFRGGEGDDPVGFWNANFGGTVHIVECARRAGVRRVVLLSSRAVFDGLEFHTEEIGDQETPSPTTHYGLVKASCEQLGNLYDDIEICSIRPTGVYGVTHPISSTKWLKLLTNHINGPGDIRVDQSRRTEVHGSDVAGAISLLLNADAAQIRGKAFNCSDIVTSEQRVLDLTKRIVNQGPNPDISDLPPLEKPKNTMASIALNSLGWRPGGQSRLMATLAEIVEHERLDR